MAARKKIFIIGASSQLGYAIGYHLRHKFLVTGACFTHQILIPGAQIYPIALKSTEVLETLLRVQRPDYIISAIGITDRKKIETLPKVADMLNVVLPASMAIFANRLRAKYIYLCCAEVFDGETGNYTEENNSYTLSDPLGKQKVAAYSYIRAQTLESTTLRIGKVLGIGHPYRMSLFDRIRFSAGAKKTYEASKHKVRSYLSSKSLALAAEQVLLGEFPSKHRVFNVGGANCTEFELVEQWYSLMKADRKLVQPIDKDSKRDLSLDCSLLERQFPPWKQESKNELLLNLLDELHPAAGAKKWRKTLQIP